MSYARTSFVFPFCQPDVPVSGGAVQPSNHPLSCTFAAMMKTYWRVKSWELRIAYSFVYDDGSLSAAGALGDVESPEALVLGASAPHELLVAEYGAAWLNMAGVNGTWEGEYLGSPVSGELVATASAGFLFAGATTPYELDDPAHWLRSGSSYIPSWRVDLNIDGGALGSTLSWFNSAEWGGVGEEQHLDVSASGLAPDGRTTGRTRATGDYYTQELVLSMAVHEWWPHDPGDGGGPVWSTANGQRLRTNPPD